MISRDNNALDTPAGLNLTISANHNGPVNHGICLNNRPSVDEHCAACHHR
jgi:hypothetical protein